MNQLQDRVRWNHRFSKPGFVPDWAPDLGLVSNLADLPAGRVLDLACGVGANALFLAKRGFQVQVVDISDVALERLRRAASAEGVLQHIELQLSSVADFELSEESYEVVICTRFLDRSLCPKIAAALTPGGVLFYQSFRKAHLDTHPEFNPEYCLEDGELPRLFPSLVGLKYNETNDAEGCFASLLAQRPR